MAGFKQLGQMSNALPWLVNTQYPAVTSGCSADTDIHQRVGGVPVDTVGSVFISSTSATKKKFDFENETISIKNVIT